MEPVVVEMAERAKVGRDLVLAIEKGDSVGVQPALNDLSPYLAYSVATPYVLGTTSGLQAALENLRCAEAENHRLMEKAKFDP